MFYAEPSFLVSLYSLDANWDAATRTMQASKGSCVITTLGEFEVINAFGLRVFRREASAAQAQSSIIDFENDLHDGIFQIRGLSDEVFERARQLSRQTTRTYKARAPRQSCPGGIP